MGIPLCLGMNGEMTSGQRNNPPYVLEAIRRIGKKLSIFCNAGCIKVPKTESRLYALLEDSIHEVRMSKSTYNFHPKVWVLQYHNIHDGSIMIKVVVMSRNLTFDQSMDIAVEMTGFVGDKINAKNQPLTDMISFVSQFDGKKNAYRQLISNVRKVATFQLLDCFEDYEFHSFGIYGNNRKGRKTARELFQNSYALFIISPFLSESVITELLEDKKHNEDAGPVHRCLITRETSVTKGIYNAFSRRDGDGIYIVDPVFCSNDILEDGDTFGYATRDVHAKVYYTEKYGEPHKLYLGSLNASRNAFEHNAEFLLELHYRNYHSSYRSIKEDFIPGEESPFTRLMDFTEDMEKPEEGAVDFRTEVYGIKSAEAVAENRSYTLKVFSDADYEGTTIRPFYVRTATKPLTREVKFKNLSLNCLSNLFLISKDGAECLVRLEVAGMPVEEREDVVFNEIISNQSMFMTYMRYLLDEDFYEGVNFTDLVFNENGAGSGMDEYSFSVQADLYEKMLRAAADYPERLDSMYEVVSKMDGEKVGEEFRQLLELFWKAAGREGKYRK